MGKIKSISGGEKGSRQGDYLPSYIVGRNGVTAITLEYSYPEAYCTTDWLVVWKGENIIAKMNARYVALIEYFSEEP